MEPDQRYSRQIIPVLFSLFVFPLLIGFFAFFLSYNLTTEYRILSNSLPAAGGGCGSGVLYTAQGIEVTFNHFGQVWSQSSDARYTGSAPLFQPEEKYIRNPNNQGCDFFLDVISPSLSIQGMTYFPLQLSFDTDTNEWELFRNSSIFTIGVSIADRYSGYDYEYAIPFFITQTLPLDIKIKSLDFDLSPESLPIDIRYTQSSSYEWLILPKENRSGDLKLSVIISLPESQRSQFAEHNAWISVIREIEVGRVWKWGSLIGSAISVLLSLSTSSVVYIFFKRKLDSLTASTQSHHSDDLVLDESISGESHTQVNSDSSQEES